MLLDRAAQVLAVEVGVDFGREDALVSEHLLHLPDRSPSFEQMGCERVAEGVGADAFFDSGIPRSLFEDGEDHDAREAAPAVVQEESILAGTGFGAFVEVAVDAFAGRGADGYEPLFVAFSDDADVALAEEEILDFQGYELRDAQSAGVEEFEHGAVAQPLDGGGIDGGDDAVDLVGREDVGELASEFGGQDEIIRKLKKLLTPLNARACEVFSRPRSKSQAMYRSIICGSTFCGGTSHMRRMKCAKDRRSRM